MSTIVGAGLALQALGHVATAAEDGTEPPELAPIPGGQEAVPGAVVHVQYTMWSARGEVLESNEGRPPLVFTLGNREVIAGLERALLGMKVGERRRVTIPPEDAYGPVDESAVTEVPKTRVPAEARVVGARLPARTRSGRDVTVRVREVRDETVVLDLNHPLAGQTLVFEIRLVLVEPP
jgi:FKBP-type peptidyl-prolyl cis-trans isomerase 2